MARSVAIFALLAVSGLHGQVFEWPDGAEAAVALTYDDGIDAHLDRAAVDLDAVGLKGTFYVPGHSPSLAKRLEEWRAMATRGHELGNHTVFHPCLRKAASGAIRDWVNPEWILENYTPRRYASEVAAMNTTLAAVDGLSERTFAYTCCDLTAGGESVVGGIRPMFPAARGGGDREVVANLKSIDFYNVPSWAVEDVSGDELIAFVREAVDAGGLAVIMFHGVEGPYLSVSREAHRTLLAWLAAHREEIWTDTFLSVTGHIRSEHERLGWSR